LLSYLDRAIKRIEASGKRDEIAQHWFGRKVFLGRTREEVLGLLAWVVAGVLVASTGATLYSYVRHKLRKAEAVLRHNLVFQHMDDGVIVTNLEGKITDWNPGAERMFGYSRKEVLGRTPAFLYTPEESTELTETINRGSQRDGIWSGEIRAVPKDGSQVVCSLRMTTLRNEKGDSIAYTSIIRDITERVRAEQALRESEEKWRSLVENAPDIIFTVDRDGKILFINRVPAGLTVEEALGTSVYDYVALEYRETTRQSIKRVFQTGEPDHYEIPARGPHDITSWYSTRLGPIKADGKVVAVMLITTDITERVRAEADRERLLEAEQQARRVAETLQAANLALSQSLDLDTILETLLDDLGQLVPYDSANVMLRETEERMGVHLIRGYESYVDPDQTRLITFDARANPIIHTLLTTRESVLIADTREHPGWERRPGMEHVLNWMGVPLVVGGEVVGLYSVDKAEAGFFTQEHLQLAESLAAQAAVAIQNARFHEQVQRDAEELEQRVTERTAELKRMVNLMVGREVRMSELKDVIHQLRGQLEAAGLTPVANDPLAAWQEESATPEAEDLMRDAMDT